MAENKSAAIIEKAPLHVGIIMDGNGRWAKLQGKPRTSGHQEGLKTAKKIALAAIHLGIKYLSLYAFSTENWKRAESEVSFLMGLIKEHLKKEYAFYTENKIRVLHSGDLSRLPADIQTEITDVTRSTAHFKNLAVNLAINYGGRDEIIRAVNRWESSSNKISPLTEDVIRNYFDHPDIPDPDLIIRTAGDMRISNFLLWGSAYSEFYFSKKLWPDWCEDDLKDAVESFTKRERKFGAVITKGVIK